FVFSSRRRHTRFSRDWSSDVCSSDLVLPVSHCIGAAAITGWLAISVIVLRRPAFSVSSKRSLSIMSLVTGGGFGKDAVAVRFARSEERRVGKECGRRWARQRGSRDAQ